MILTIDRALHPVARRPGLLQPDEVIDLLSCRRNWRVTAEQLADCLERPLDQVLHCLSYMTSLGLLKTQRDDGAWYYTLAIAQAC
jgi:DNA-binding IclR family transcriptional regulator